MKKILVLISLSAFMMACENLMTRGDVKEAENKRQMQDQVVNLQKNTADTSNRFAEIESDLRSLNGRVEVAENKINQVSQDKERGKNTAEQNLSEQAKKTQILQDEVGKLQEQLQALSAELNAMKAAGANVESAAASKKDQFEIGDDFFEKKEWKRAILSYQKYRDTSPKGKKLSEATYKIGVCFQELGLKDEARTFYDEVIAKYPNSGDAKKARTRLKSLKK